jgi:hypothetical protein
MAQIGEATLVVDASHLNRSSRNDGPEVPGLNKPRQTHEVAAADFIGSEAHWHQ